MSEPTVAALNEILHDLTDNWEQFALYLPLIVQSDIETITINEKHLAKQKIALYNKWLHVCTNASWDDVVKALENPAVKENTIAQRVRDRYCGLNSDDQVTNSPSPSSQSIPIVSPRDQSSTAEADEVEVSEEVVKELNTLHKSFVDLTRDVKTEVKRKVVNKNLELSSVTYSLQEERAFPIPLLESVQTADELFKAIHPHYNFLNCYLIVSIALRFLFGLIAEKASEYKDEVVQFMKTKNIRYLRNALKPYHVHSFQSSSKIIVEIAVPDYWDRQNVWLVKKLIETLFLVKDPDELPWYDIVPGSVIMTFIALEHMTSSLIESSRKKTEFMRLIGVISLKIGDEIVWQREDGDAVLSFEDSLIRATLADNIEAVLFLLKYAQVDINTRNTNRTLFNVQEEMYNSELEIESNLNTLYSTFNLTQTSIVELSATTSGDENNVPVDIPHDNFLNGRRLASMELPEEQHTKISNYIKILDNNKRFFPLHYLQKNLQKYFPTPFSGSIEVIISLHSVWSTCSIWYVEQLGQLIFTPTLFYQLQWFRVDRREESVRVCLLADGKIMNSLKECVGDNESRTSMLGVVSVQVDDTVMIINDCSDGYTFNEAIELAKAIGNHEISALLQQIFISPVDCKTLIAPADENNNCCFIPDPDFTPLMIACCNDNSQLVQLLLDHNADPNIRNRRDITALMYSTGNSKIFQMLLDHGANINRVTFYNVTAMHFACIIGNIKNVKTLKDKDQALLNTKDNGGQQALKIASQFGHTAVAELLLQAHADPNIQDNKGWTALEAASRYGHTAVVELLLRQAHADPNIQDNEGHTALEAASRYGHTAVVELLLQAHADANIQDNEGRTALEEASSDGHTAVVELLLQAQADPDIQDNEGWTALMLACSAGHKDIIVKLLLQAKADPTLLNHQGQTALDLAMQYKHVEIIDLMCQAMFD